MENERNNQGKRRVSRQNWNPGGLNTARGIWMGVYTVIKIILGALATVLLVGIVCGFIFMFTLGDYLEGDIAPLAGVQLEGFDLNEPSYVYYVDDSDNIQVLQKLYPELDREWVDYEDIPEHLINAAVAIEDHRFFEHQGVDWFTTLKACVNMFVGSGDQFGGSSITQQLIKNLMLMEDEGADDVTVQRKVLEIFRATEFERRYDKSVVLEWYLNKIYLGNRCEGVKAAAAKYFGKELEHLTAAECACLISITNNPSLFDPYRTSLDSKGLTGMQQNDIRRTNTLYMMRQYGYLTEEEYQEALNQQIVLKDGIDPEDRVADCDHEGCGYHGKVGTFVLQSDGRYYCPQCGNKTEIGVNASQEVYSWFADTAVRDVAKQMAAEAGMEWNDQTQRLYLDLITNGGYHIYTTLNMDVQRQVDKIYQDLNEIPKTASVQQLQSAIVIIDNNTGDIVALAGGVGEKEVYFGYSRAESDQLQPGSSIKPLTIYAPAFELGLFTPASVQKDMPLYYTQDPENPTAEPKPYPLNTGKASYAYRRNILYGVTQSVNTIAVQTLNNIGLEYSFNFAKEKFGLSTLIESEERNGITYSDIGLSPLGMGAPTDGVTVRAMSAAYATFANNGVYREARTFTKVYNSDGEVVLSNTQDSEQILSEKTVTYMNYCLENVVKAGTGTAAQISGQVVAGKTGSTTSNKDRWFCGFTDYYTAAIWCGYDMPEVIQLTEDGRNPATVLFNKVMKPIHEGLQSSPLYDDSRLVEVGICLDSGKLACDACKHDVRGSRVVYAHVYPEDVPKETCDKHIFVDYCVDGVASEYCKNMANLGQVTLTKKALVKMTQDELDAIIEATGKGLHEEYTKDNYIYLVDASGNPIPFYGIHGDINGGTSNCCEYCSKHTKSAWDNFLSGTP
ncbi:MAG: transglycosylase domain-containing protein [Oscillospiraceae bacterium]|nr:transglycosylase domain-containing protein [Oscillospiraceae bacterium]